MFGLEFIKKFPFIRKIKIRYVEKKLNTDNNKPDNFESLVHLNRNILLQNQVSINKIRFVYQPTFTYDVDNNNINPNYTIMHPVDNDGFNVNTYPIIEIGKPKNIIHVSVNSYKTFNNFQYLKEVLKSSKRGIVIFICDYCVVTNYGDFKGYSEKSYVSDEIIRFVNLDEAVSDNN